MDKSKRKPCFYGAIVLIFPHGVSIAKIRNLLSEVVEYPEYIEATFLEVKDFYSWNVDDLLTKLFSICDINRIHKIVALYQATVLIDIAVYHHDSYPALVFESENMALIHKLKANISIDIY